MPGKGTTGMGGARGLGRDLNVKQHEEVRGDDVQRECDRLLDVAENDFEGGKEGMSETWVTG